MIVFVPEGSKLRYTSGPLEISGRLDVGIKVDEWATKQCSACTMRPLKAYNIQIIKSLLNLDGKRRLLHF
ncbi:hypothetical protein D3C74_440130 [compost metagenome]